MSTKNAGGSAFPVNASDTRRSASGMWLRDWFAGMALQGYIAAGLPSDLTHQDVAEKVYRAADAMIEERDR